MIAKLAVAAQESKPTKQRNSTPKTSVPLHILQYLNYIPLFSFQGFACFRNLISSQLLPKTETFPSPLPRFINLAGTRVLGSAKHRCDNSQPCPGLCDQAVRYELQSVGYSLLPANISEYIQLWHSSVITKVSRSSARRNSFKSNTILH